MLNFIVNPESCSHEETNINSQPLKRTKSESKIKGLTTNGQRKE